MLAFGLECSGTFLRSVAGPFSFERGLDLGTGTGVGVERHVPLLSEPAGGFSCLGEVGGEPGVLVPLGVVQSFRCRLARLRLAFGYGLAARAGSSDVTCADLFGLSVIPLLRGELPPHVLRIEGRLRRWQTVLLAVAGEPFPLLCDSGSPRGCLAIGVLAFRHRLRLGATILHGLTRERFRVDATAAQLLACAAELGVPVAIIGDLIPHGAHLCDDGLELAQSPLDVGEPGSTTVGLVGRLGRDGGRALGVVRVGSVGLLTPVVVGLALSAVRLQPSLDPPVQDLRYRLGGVELASRDHIGEHCLHVVADVLNVAQQRIQRVSRRVRGDLEST